MSGRFGTETSDQFWRRLDKAGLWGEFTDDWIAYRDEHKCRKDEAKSVVATWDKYRPADAPAPEPVDEPEDEELLEILASVDPAEVDVQQSFVWAAANLSKKQVSLEDVKGAGLTAFAWELWKWGHDAPATFWKEAVKYLDKRKASEEQKAFEDDKRRQFGLIEAFSEVTVCRHCGKEP